MGIFIKETLPEESARKQVKYLKNTTKPRKLKVKKWVRRIKNINSLLPMMGGTKLSEEEIVKEVIAPNLPELWSKSFHLAGAHLHQSTKKAMNVLEILENDEQLHKPKLAKPYQRNQRTQVREECTPSRKNMCKHHLHPNAKHEWKDCIYNPKSKNYCGHTGKQDKKKEEENHHIRSKRYNKTVTRHPMSSSSSSENSLKSDTSSVESNYQIEEKSTKQTSDTMSAELLLGTKVSNQTYRTLLDTGSSASIISHEVAKQLQKEELGKIKKTLATKWSTQTGRFVTIAKITAKALTLPQFTTKRTFQATFHVLNKDDKPHFDAIMGRDLQQQLGINVLNSEKHFQWDDILIPMVPKGHWQNKNKILQQLDSKTDLKHEQMLLESNYQPEDLTKIGEKQIHLPFKQQQELQKLLQKYEPLFQGKLGEWANEKFTYQLKPNVQPYHRKPYRVPHAIKKIFRQEIDRLVKEKVFSPNSDSQWGAPTFAIPKKDGRICIVTDFRELNKRLIRTPFPLPNIRDLRDSILHQVEYFTTLDIMQGFYHMKLMIFPKICVR